MSQFQIPMPIHTSHTLQPQQGQQLTRWQIPSRPKMRATGLSHMFVPVPVETAGTWNHPPSCGTNSRPGPKNISRLKTQYKQISCISSWTWLYNVEMLYPFTFHHRINVADLPGSYYFSCYRAMLCGARYVVCLSVRLSICLSVCPWRSGTVKYFENNFTAK